MILKQTEGTGINVYTHGEMLPAHGYPSLKKYPHFYGHYGTAWQNQHKEFAHFPGAIVMTTNCIQKPLESYKDNLFTCGLVGWPDVKHIGRRQFCRRDQEGPVASGIYRGRTGQGGFRRIRAERGARRGGQGDRRGQGRNRSATSSSWAGATAQNPAGTTIRSSWKKRPRTPS